MIFSSRLDWLKWRRAGIGGSDAAALWGEHRKLTKFGLYEEKLSTVVVEQVENEYITQRGHDREVVARKKMAAIYNIENFTEEDFAPRCLEMRDFPFIRTSLDGSTKDGLTIAEYKFMAEPLRPNRDPSKGLPPGYQKHLAVLNGEVPRDYWIQCQHNLMVSGARVCMFGSLCGDVLNECRIMPDVEFMKEHLDRCIEFWEHVQRAIPPAFEPRDYKELRAKGAKGLMQAYRVALGTPEAERIKMEILALAKMDGHPRLTIDGVRLDEL